MNPPVGDWNDVYEAQGRQLAKVFDAYMKDIAPGFRVSYSPANWDSAEGLLLIAACRLLCRRGVLRMEMREAAEHAEVQGHWIMSQVAGRWFDAMTMDERQQIKGLHFDLDESKWKVIVTLVKEDDGASDHPAGPTAPDDGARQLPDGATAFARRAGSPVSGVIHAASGPGRAGQATEAAVLSPPGEGELAGPGDGAVLHGARPDEQAVRVADAPAAAGDSLAAPRPVPEGAAD